MSDVKLFNGDCLKVMQDLIDDDIKVDLVLTDPPYGTTACKWDSIIPFEPMWDCLEGITNPTTPILLFGTQPFMTELIHSNLTNFKYNLIWDKQVVNNPMLCKKRPLRVHEEIAIFYKKQPYYNPQRVPRRFGDQTRVGKSAEKITMIGADSTVGEHWCQRLYIDDGTRYPQSIIHHINSQANECNNINRYHPTQKPVTLLKWLIQNYTKENDTVLDFTMGSGSTGVACQETNRNFIGIELDTKYYEIAEQRIKEAKAQRRLI